MRDQIDKFINETELKIADDTEREYKLVTNKYIQNQEEFKNENYNGNERF